MVRCLPTRFTLCNESLYASCCFCGLAPTLCQFAAGLHHHPSFFYPGVRLTPGTVLRLVLQSCRYSRGADLIDCAIVGDGQTGDTRLLRTEAVSTTWSRDINGPREAGHLPAADRIRRRGDGFTPMATAVDSRPERVRGLEDEYSERLLSQFEPARS